MNIDTNVRFVTTFKHIKGYVETKRVEMSYNRFAKTIDSKW